MGRPLHTSFTLRPCSKNGDTGYSPPQLTLRPAMRRLSSTSSYSTRRRLFTSPNDNDNDNNAVRFRVSFEDQQKERNNSQRVTLPFDFEPPADQDYWKKRCFQWQEVCQQSRKRVRVMEEDQRQLRRRIWELEEALLRRQPCNNNHHHHHHHDYLENEEREDNNSKAQISVDESHHNKKKCGKPPMIVTIPSNSRNSAFRFTDSEGLSESDDEY